MKSPASAQRPSNPISRAVIWLATGFGLGYSPVASGTVGSIPGVVIVLLSAHLPLAQQIALAVVLALVAIPITGHAEECFGRKDDGRIVADEYLTFLICVLGLPWLQHPWLLGVAFVTNRVADIIKPFPARQAQNLAGGLGIVLDDVLACLYALALNHGIWYAASRWLL